MRLWRIMRDDHRWGEGLPSPRSQEDSMRARHVSDGTLHGISSPDETHARCTRRAFLSALMPGVVLATRAFAQPSGDLRDQFRQRSEAAERTGLAEPFTGITTDGQVMPGLFPI
jgi:hypothetical protein